MPRHTLPPGPLVVRAVPVALWIASLAACGAATGVDVGSRVVDAGPDVDATVPSCSDCALPSVCVTRSDPGSPSVSRPYACEPAPASCDGVVTCACAATLCRDETCLSATSTPYRALVTCFAP
jgi:hypothetical protein